jgi:hypothetical protein
MNKLSRQKIILTPTEKSLIGRINADTEHCHILLDTTNGPFTVILPDATGSMQKELIFKNIGTNNATIVPITGQWIDNVITKTIAPLDSLDLWSDLIKTWWIL